MAARGSFQKRKKEAERREKRQVKLDRRQGRQPIGGTPASSETSEDETALNTEGLENPAISVTPGLEDSAPAVRPLAVEEIRST